MQLLLQLQQAILQPCASYGCEIWGLATAAMALLCELQILQQSYLRRACRGKRSVLIDIIYEELAVTR